MDASPVMTTRVPHGVLRSRIDPGFYAPEHLEREQRLQRLGVVRPAIGEVASLVTDGTHKTPNYVKDGVPFLSATNISDGAITFADHKFVPRSEFLQLRAWKCAPHPSDVVVAKSGSIGNAAVVPLHAPEFAVFESVAIIRPGRFDPYYLATFLNSRIGQEEIRRQTKGAVIRHLHLEDLREVEVPEFSKEAQRYIGDKVRLAERLRERARNLRGELEDQLSMPAVVAALSTNDQRANRVSASDLSPRLDSKYYGSRSMAVLRTAAVNSVAVGALVEEVSNGFEHRDFVADGTPYITVTEVSGGRLVLGTAPRLGAEVAIPRKAQLDTCCALVVRTGSIGVAVPVFEEDTHAAISSHLIRLRFKTEEEAAVVAAFLNSEGGRVLQRKISYGAVQPQIGQDELLALPVPKMLVDSAASILELLRTEDAALRAAQRLVSSATLLVENLIEGRVAEAELVAAEKALESGDRGPDRAILQALRQTGNSAQPLIPDLDGLYALLDKLEDEPAQ